MQSKTDWSRLRSKVAAASADEHPEADIHHIVRGVVRRGLKPLPAKASISLRVDQDVLEWFKEQGLATKRASMPSCVRSVTRRSNPSIERIASSKRRLLPAAAHVER
jgi:uncharacterized protein (DUF4415 family)